jgi:cobalt-zinc-cadmium efflux system outer membrane protein
MWFVAVLLAATSPSASTAPRDVARTATAALDPSPLVGPEWLAPLVRAGAPDVRASETDVDVAIAGERQSERLGNPSLDLSWGTIPIGPTNPRDLADPLGAIPNYGVGLSYTVPLAKRGPTQRRATATRQATEATRDASVRDATLALADVLGRLAATTLRRGGLVDLAADAGRAVDLAELRVAAQLGSPLDVARLRIERARTDDLLRGVDGELAALRASCAPWVGRPCADFASPEAARAFLDAWLTRAPHGDGAARTAALTATIDARPDLAALAFAEDAARADATLARRQALPDPTIRLGFVHDSFAASGAQPNALNLAVALPLPVFDAGQAAEQAAERRSVGLAAQRARLRDAARARVPALLDTLDAQLARRRHVTDDTIPEARRVLADVARAVDQRLLPLSDLLQSRRALSELLLEEADAYLAAYQALLGLYAERGPEAGEGGSP